MRAGAATRANPRPAPYLSLAVDNVHIFCYSLLMKPIRFDNEKDISIKKKRDVGFRDIVNAIQNNQVLDIIKNPNRKQYSRQKMFIIKLHNYIYVVPFVENDKEIFLKTVFPSRKYTKKYLGN